MNKVGPSIATYSAPDFLMSLADVNDTNPEQHEGVSWREERDADRRSRVRTWRQRLESNRKASGSTIQPIRTRNPVPAQPVPPPADGPIPLRLRLDPTDEPGSEPTPEPRQKLRLVTRVVEPYRRFYSVCPHCRSEEVYPVTWRGLFIERNLHRNPFIQRMQCERCLNSFLRPGWALGGVLIPLRPRGLYD